ncbi:glycosyltransferase family protein [Toxoplasma gondii GAB2-2007-GAL-DOM2]|uniref:Glycosyltransferase family protein n=5 Tax=Toxoplasma gondii TaxID=5811 RepID=S7VW57_TOXGG|nr:hypothetical protein TGGT1_266320 [Toxoplasma gondii GT1]KAF4644165.1 hypothetical protein TGRH88_011570 [Toxoplasma gondii]KFG38704.1 glycosyltransferase family protein [Toxoplasma gondii GAB2-2007-GAL-DOM2]KFG41808.1 glycosyltransferase family protein [Toxoplasma gondii FOU]RQX74080.1 glycosyltransferase family protein [Toxoplasma gondii CAST]
MAHSWMPGFFCLASGVSITGIVPSVCSVGGASEMMADARRGPPGTTRKTSTSSVGSQNRISLDLQASPSASPSSPVSSPSLCALECSSDPEPDDGEDGALLNVACSRFSSEGDAIRLRQRDASLKPEHAHRSFLSQFTNAVSAETGGQDCQRFEERSAMRGRRVFSQVVLSLFVLVIVYTIVSSFFSLVRLRADVPDGASARSSLFSFFSFFSEEEEEEDAGVQSLRRLATLSSIPVSVENFARIAAPSLLLLASDDAAFHPAFFSSPSRAAPSAAPRSDGLSSLSSPLPSTSSAVRPSAASPSFVESEESEEAQALARERAAASPLTCVELIAVPSDDSQVGGDASLAASLLSILEGSSSGGVDALESNEMFRSLLERVKKRASSQLDAKAPWTLERAALHAGAADKRGEPEGSGDASAGGARRRPSASLFLPNWRVVASGKTPISASRFGAYTEADLRRHVCVSVDREYGVRFVSLLSALASPVSEEREDADREGSLAGQRESRTASQQSPSPPSPEDACSGRVSLYDGCSSLPIRLRPLSASPSSSSPSSSSSSPSSSPSSFGSHLGEERFVAHMYWGGTEPLTAKELWSIDSFFASAPRSTLRLHVVFPTPDEDDFLWDSGEAAGSVSPRNQDAGASSETGSKGKENMGGGNFFASWRRRKSDAMRRRIESVRGLHLSQLQLFWRKGYDLQYVQHVTLKPYLVDTPLAARASSLRVSSLADNSALFGLLRHARQATVSDILRVLFLYKEGGLYLDVDVLTLRSFASLPSFLVCENPNFERDEAGLRPPRDDTQAAAKAAQKAWARQRSRDRTAFRPCELTNSVFKFKKKSHLFLRDLLHYIDRHLAAASVGRLAVGKWGILGPLAFRAVFYRRWVTAGVAGVWQEREREEAEAQERTEGAKAQRRRKPLQQSEETWYVLRFANSPPKPRRLPGAASPTSLEVGESREGDAGDGKAQEEEAAVGPFVRPLWLFGSLSFEPLQPGPQRGRFPVLESDIFWTEERSAEGFLELQILGKSGPFHGLHLFSKALFSKRNEGFLSALRAEPLSVVGILQKTFCTAYCGNDMLRIFSGEEIRQRVPDAVLDKIKAVLSWL